MKTESVNEQARAIVQEVLRGVDNVEVGEDRWGHTTVSLCQVNEDTGEMLSQVVASTRGFVMRPELVAKEGLTAKMEEVARRLGLLGVRSEDPSDAPYTEACALARSVMAGSGENGVCERDDEGHWRVGIETRSADGWRVEFQVLATTRGDVPMPRLAEKLGLLSHAKALARQLGELGVRHPPPPLSEEQAAQVSEAMADLRSVFARGIHPLDQVPDATGGGAWEEVDEVRVQREVMRQFIQHVRAHAEEERQWPEVIETDRLEAAFDELRRSGIVAKMGAGHTLSDGWSAVQEEAAEGTGLGQEPWAAAFFHQQDIDLALEGEALCIAFGTLGEEEALHPSEAVGQAVVEALRRHGFEPEWNGDGHTRITLLPAFTWRRRRAKVDTTEHLTLDLLDAGLVELLPRARTLRMRFGAMTLYDLERMRSNVIEELTLDFSRGANAREVLPDLLERLKGRLPQLQTLTVQDGNGFQETVSLAE